MLADMLARNSLPGGAQLAWKLRLALCDCASTASGCPRRARTTMAAPTAMVESVPNATPVKANLPKALARLCKVHLDQLYHIILGDEPVEVVLHGGDDLNTLNVSVLV